MSLTYSAQASGSKINHSGHQLRSLSVDTPRHEHLEPLPGHFRGLRAMVSTPQIKRDRKCASGAIHPSSPSLLQPSRWHPRTVIESRNGSRGVCCQNSGMTDTKRERKWERKCEWVFDIHSELCSLEWMDASLKKKKKKNSLPARIDWNHERRRGKKVEVRNLVFFWWCYWFAHFQTFCLDVFHIWNLITLMNHLEKKTNILVMNIICFAPLLHTMMMSLPFNILYTVY